MKDKNITGFDGEMFHPSLDIKSGALVLGFRYRETAKEEKDLVLVVYDGNISIARGDSFSIKDKECFLEKRGRKLMKIEERWSLGNLNKFMEEYANFPRSGVPEATTLYEEILALVRKYVELEKDMDYLLVAAWIAGTYFFPVFSAYPFLNIKAPKRSGKSQLLNLLRQLCFNAVKARPTLAALGDTVDSLRGTYLIDQADSLERKGGEELLDILADSYKRGGGKRRVIQMDKGKRSTLEFEIYGPKVFASIRELPEDLRDRCLIIPLIRSQHNFLDPDEADELLKETRSKLYRFLVDKYSLVECDYTVRKIEYKGKPEVLGRTLELWLPVEIMLRCFGKGNIILEARKRFLSQYGFAEYEPSEAEEGVVKAILEQFKDGKIDILLAPRAINEFLNPETFPSDISSNQRTARIGWTIKKFNLSSEKKRTKDGICYLFEKEKVEAAYRAYFPTLPTPEEKGLESTREVSGVGLDVGI